MLPSASSCAVPADALALCGVDYLVVGPKVLATLKDSQTLQVGPMLHMRLVTCMPPWIRPACMARFMRPAEECLSKPVPAAAALGYSRGQCAVRKSAGAGVAVLALTYTSADVNLTIGGQPQSCSPEVAATENSAYAHPSACMLAESAEVLCWCRVTMMA